MSFSPTEQKGEHTPKKEKEKILKEEIIPPPPPEPREKTEEEKEQRILSLSVTYERSPNARAEKHPSSRSSQRGKDTHERNPRVRARDFAFENHSDERS